MSNENKKFVVSPENPDGILVDMTPEEITQRETDIARHQSEKTDRETAETNKTNLKASAKAKLKKLGLTDDEIKATLGV